MQFIIVSSSRGTTMQAVLDALQNGSLRATCLGLISDREDRGCVEKAKAAGLAVSIVNANPKSDRETFDRMLDKSLSSLIPPAVDKGSVIIAEMGWMWIHTPWFIDKWKNQILNVHPALLPKYGGKGMYGHHVHQAVLSAHEKESGVTFHWIDNGVDTGPILVQKSCSVLGDDTAESLKERIQELEKEWYPKVLQQLHEEDTIPLLP